MRKIISILRIAVLCLYKSLRYPRSNVMGLSNPRDIRVSPVPWWGSGIILVVGIIAWVLSARWNIAGLDEAARVMVYIPIGNIFGMSVNLANKGVTGGGK